MGGRANLALPLSLCLGAASCGGAEPANPRRPATAPQFSAAAAAPADTIPFDVTLVTVDGPTQALDPALPLVILRGRHVWMNGGVVADVAEPAKPGRLARIEPLWQALKTKRETWKASHGDAPFTGDIALAFDAHDDVAVVKSVFQTAAFSGYPNAQFVVRNKERSLGVLRAEAVVPSPPRPGEEPASGYLVAQIGKGTALAFWQKRGEPRDASLGGTGALGPMVQAEWSANGLHRAATDRKRDLAFLFVDNDEPFSALALALASLVSVSRDLEASGRVERVPALSVMLMLAGHTDRPENLGIATAVNGRLPPEEIQKTVRAQVGPMRKCYEAGLGRDAALNGKVETKFVIERDGKVSASQPTENTTMKDPAVVSCVVAEFGKLVFPPPEGGIVTVVYPIIFNPGD